MRTGNYRPCEAGQRAHQRIITPQASTSAQTLSRQTETHNINNTKTNTKREKTHNWSTGISPDYHTPSINFRTDLVKTSTIPKKKRKKHKYIIGLWVHQEMYTPSSLPIRINYPTNTQHQPFCRKIYNI